MSSDSKEADKVTYGTEDETSIDDKLIGYHTDSIADDINIHEDAYLLQKNKNMLPYATSFLSQFVTLSKRNFYNFIRNYYLMPAHFGAAIILGLLLGGVSVSSS